MIILFIPIVIYEYIPGTTEVWDAFKFFFILSIWIWGSFFADIPAGVYIVISLLYLTITLVIFMKKGG